MSYKYYDTEEKKHFHELNGKALYGTSTVCKVLAAPALIQWAANEAVKHISKLLGEAGGDASLLDWDVLLEEARTAHARKRDKAAVKGTDLHALLEEYVKECLKNGGEPYVEITGDKKVIRFSEWAYEFVDVFLWSEAHCYSEALWVGGITDAGARMKDGKVALLDFKSSREAYFNHFVQAGGYARLIEENGLLTADGEQYEKPITVDVLYIVPFGAEDPTPRPHFDVAGRKRNFESAVDLYKSSEIFKK